MAEYDMVDKPDAILPADRAVAFQSLARAAAMGAGAQAERHPGRGQRRLQALDRRPGGG